MWQDTITGDSNLAIAEAEKIRQSRSLNKQDIHLNIVFVCDIYHV